MMGNVEILGKKTRCTPTFIGQEEKGNWQMREKFMKLKVGKLKLAFTENKSWESFSVNKEGPLLSATERLLETEREND